MIWYRVTQRAESVIVTRYGKRASPSPTREPAPTPLRLELRVETQIDAPDRASKPFIASRGTHLMVEHCQLSGWRDRRADDKLLGGISEVRCS